MNELVNAQGHRIASDLREWHLYEWEITFNRNRGSGMPFLNVTDNVKAGSKKDAIIQACDGLKINKSMIVKMIRGRMLA